MVLGKELPVDHWSKSSMCVPKDDLDYNGAAVVVPIKGLGVSKEVTLAKKGDRANMTFLERRDEN